MPEADPRDALKALASERGDSLAALSTMLGRNAAYLQQFIGRGSPRQLPERDRRLLADYFGVAEAMLGGPPSIAAPRIRRLDVSASAGPGAFVDREIVLGSDRIDPDLMRALQLDAAHASIIRARGDSMEPGLRDGDHLVIDERDIVPPVRGGVYVIRVGDATMVKRVARGRTGLVVSSDNPSAAPVSNDGVSIIGRVVWQMRGVV